MPRSVSGNYTLPLPPVVPNTVIQAAWANTTDDDIAQALTDSLDRYGRGGMVAPFRLVDGSESIPAWAFNAETGTGMWRDGDGILAVSVQGAKIAQWSPLGYSLMPGMTLAAENFSVDNIAAVTIEADNIILGEVEALNLTAPGAAIVWRLAGTEDPPGLVISRVASTQVMVVRGLGGLSFEDSTTAFQFFGAVLAPQITGSVALGSPTLPWGNIHGARQIGLSEIFGWHSSIQSLDLGNFGAITNDSINQSLNVVFNLYYNGSNWLAKENVRSTLTNMRPDSVNWYTAAAVAPDAAATLKAVMNLDTVAPRLSLTAPSGSVNSIGLNAGNGTNSGYLEFYRPDTGARTGYIGSVAPAGVDVGIISYVAQTHYFPSFGASLYINSGASSGKIAVQAVGTTTGIGSPVTGYGIFPQASEPTVYSMQWDAVQTATPGFPVLRYGFYNTQYTGVNNYSVTIAGLTAKWDFLVAIGNPSSGFLKSNWAYETGALVDALALITDVGSFDFSIGTYPLDGPEVARRGLPIQYRQVGVSAEQLQVAMPDAVEPSSTVPGALSVAYGNAAMVACIALAKRLKAIEAFVGL